MSYSNISDLERINEELKREVEERKRAEAQLEQRNQLLSTLLDVSNLISSTMGLKPLFGAILDRLKTIIDYTGAKILIIEGDYLRIYAHRSLLTEEGELRYNTSYTHIPLSKEVIYGKKPVVIPDIRGDSPVAKSYRETVSNILDLEGTFGYMRSWAGIPMIVKDRVIGILTIDHSEPDYYKPHHIELGLAFANQAAIEFENARLYSESVKRMDELRTMFAVQQAITSRLDLDTVIKLIADEAKRLTNSERTAVFLVEGADLVLSVFSGKDSSGFLGYRIPIENSTAGKILLSGKPLLINNAEENPDIYTGLLEKAGVKSFLGIPLVSGSKPIGMIGAADKAAGEFNDNDIRIMNMLASSAVIGLENARMYREELRRHEEQAVAAERSRLARDLHDAVTQTLFSASLIAEVLPKIWERNKNEGLKRLEEIRQLARGALAEMRTLLLELRPAALVDAGLDELLKHMAESTTGRARIPVRLEIGGQACIPTDVKIGFYRIAQEALNNVAKHSGASQAAVILKVSKIKRQEADVVELTISDNGRGFTQKYVSGEHLGLNIMRERAEAIGAKLEIKSAEGEGTDVVIQWES